MLAPRFEDRDEWGTAKFSFDGNESGVFKPAEDVNDRSANPLLWCIEPTQQRWHNLTAHASQRNNQLVLFVGHVRLTHLLQDLRHGARSGIAEFADCQFALSWITRQAGDQTIDERGIFGLLASHGTQPVEHLSGERLQFRDAGQFQELTRTVFVAKL